MIATALNWIKQKYQALQQKYEGIKQAVSSFAGAKTADPDDDAAQARRKLNDALESLPDDFAKLANTFSENAQLKRFIDVGALFTKEGQKAGLWGIREPEIGDIAEMHVRMTKSLIDEECESNQRKLSSQVKILKTIRKNAKRDYNTKNAYYEKINRAYQYSQRQFSLVLGVLYGSVAFVLVVADIPLALELTKLGFNLPLDENNPISDLFLFPTRGSLGGFIFHFFRVLAANWEVVLLATGVAFCTVYIKIFYDDFIGVPLENLIKKASESPTANYEEWNLAQTGQATNNGAPEHSKEALNHKKEITEQFSRLWWRRFYVKLSVLLLLLLTIFVLGIFRYENRVDESPNAVHAVITLAAYCLMTLIFPIISGICSSLSLNSFHNWGARRTAGKRNSEAREALINATDEYRDKKEEEERNSGFIHWLSQDETINLLKKYLIRRYEAGFKFGYLYPEWTFSGDLFTRAEALRNRNLTDPTASLNGFHPLTSDQINQTAIN